MKRLSLIIGNNTELSGIAKDIKNIQTFLKSHQGGAWKDEEIITRNNPNLKELQQILISIKQERYDYIMVFFTGHGGRKHDKTYLQLNDDGELISQASLERLCARQMNIYDCCRTSITEDYSTPVFESLAFDSATSELSLDEIRKIYNQRILHSPPQQLILYACSIDEGAEDKPKGALYLTELLDYVRHFTRDQPFHIALQAHIVVAEEISKNSEGYQNPDYLAPKFRKDDQLILSINPLRYVH